VMAETGQAGPSEALDAMTVRAHALFVLRCNHGLQGLLLPVAEGVRGSE
jgi:hypothetical protein